MSVYFKTQRTVIQSTLIMAEVSFGFTEGSFLQLNSQNTCGQ